MPYVTRENLIPVISELNERPVDRIDTEVKEISQENPYWGILGAKLKEFLGLEQADFDRKLFDSLYLLLDRLVVGDKEYSASLLDRFVEVQKKNNDLIEGLRRTENEEETAKFFDTMIQGHDESYFLDFAFVVAFQYTRREEYRLMYFFALKMLIDTLLASDE